MTREVSSMSDSKNAQDSVKMSPNVKLASAVTVAAVLAYVIAVVLLWAKADHARDLTWARQTFLLAGIEAITFAAIGWLFGREINRARAERAEVAEQEAKSDADHAKTQASAAMATGSALRRAIAAQAGVRPESSERLGSRGTDASPAPDLASLRAIAEFFPE
jgi:hypothetical protein